MCTGSSNTTGANTSGTTSTLKFVFQDPSVEKVDAYGSHANDNAHESTTLEKTKNHFEYVKYLGYENIKQRTSNLKESDNSAENRVEYIKHARDILQAIEYQ